MARQPVLLTGATGATGGYAVDALKAFDVPIRAMVRKDDERAARLRQRGVEVVLGDLLDLDAVRAALEGVSAAYFVYPLHLGLIDAAATFAQAAKEAGTSAIVAMSQISARREATSHQARDHFIAEQVFDWSGVPTTHLRPTFFAEWLTYPWVRKSIAEDGVIALPFGQGRHAPIAAQDQARVIAAVLADPAPHAGRRYTLTGPVEMDHDGIAAAVGDALGRTVTYVPTEIDGFGRMLTAMGLPERMVQHLRAVALDYRHGIFAGVTDAVEAVTGSPPMTVQAFVVANRPKWGGSTEPR